MAPEGFLLSQDEFSGGFVGEGLRAEYAVRRGSGRRKSFCLSPPTEEPPPSSSPSKDLANSTDLAAATSARRNSIPTESFYGGGRRLSYPLAHNYTPLTAVPTLGRALTEGSMGQREVVQSFLTMLAQSSQARPEKRRKKGPTRREYKRRRSSDYDEQSDGEQMYDRRELADSAGLSRNSSTVINEELMDGLFSGFNYPSGTRTSPRSGGTVGQAGPRPGISFSEPLVPDFSSALDMEAHIQFSQADPPITRSRSMSCSGPQTMSHQYQQQSQYLRHIDQTNKRLQELRQKHIARLKRQAEPQFCPQPSPYQRHSCDFSSLYSHNSRQSYLPQVNLLELEAPYRSSMGYKAEQMSLHHLPGEMSHPAYSPEFNHLSCMAEMPSEQQKSLSQEQLEMHTRALMMKDGPTEDSLGSSGVYGVLSGCYLEPPSTLTNDRDLTGGVEPLAGVLDNLLDISDCSVSGMVGDEMSPPLPNASPVLQEMCHFLERREQPSDELITSFFDLENH